MDPIELRLKNYAEVDPESGSPWSSNGLRECYAQGAERFGWARRNPEPRSMRDGRWLVGMGMATASYPVGRVPGPGEGDDPRRRLGRGPERHGRPRHRRSTPS